MSQKADDREPLSYLGELPIYASYITAAVYAALMIITVILSLIGLEWVYDYVFATSADILRGQVWRVITYSVYNPPSISLVFILFFLAWVGKELEVLQGRRYLFLLYGVIYIMVPAIVTLHGLVSPSMAIGPPSSIGLLVAWAVFQPRRPFFFGIQLRWVAVVAVSIYFLIHTYNKDTTSLAILLGTSAFAFVHAHHYQGSFSFAGLLGLNKPRKTKKSPKQKPKKANKIVFPAQRPEIEKVVPIAEVKMSPEYQELFRTIQARSIAQDKAQNKGRDPKEG